MTGITVWCDRSLPIADLFTEASHVEGKACERAQKDPNKVHIPVTINISFRPPRSLLTAMQCMCGHSFGFARLAPQAAPWGPPS